MKNCPYHAYRRPRSAPDAHPLADRAPPVRDHRCQLRRQGDDLDRRHAARERPEARPCRPRFPALRLLAQLRDIADPRRLAPRPLRVEARLSVEHHPVVGIHRPAGLRGSHRQRTHRGADALRPSALPRGGRGAVVSGQQPNRRGLVPRPGARHRRRHLQLGAVLLDRPVLSSDGSDHPVPRLAVRVLDDGGAGARLRRDLAARGPCST